MEGARVSFTGERWVSQGNSGRVRVESPVPCSHVIGELLVSIIAGQRLKLLTHPFVDGNWACNVNYMFIQFSLTWAACRPTAHETFIRIYNI